MAQVTSKTPGWVQAKNELLSVIQTGNTALLTIPVEDVKELGLTFVVAGFALDTFLVQGRTHPDAAFVTLYSAAGDFTSPTGLVIDASGDLTTQAVGTGWLILDTRPLYEVKILASSSSASNSTVSSYAIGK